MKIKDPVHSYPKYNHLFVLKSVKAFMVQNLTLAMQNKLICLNMSFPLLVFSLSDYFIQVIDTNSNTDWQTVQIQIIWLLEKPTDLDLLCLAGELTLNLLAISLLFGSGLVRVTCGKAKLSLRRVRCFFPGFSGFRPPLMKDQLDISEIFLKRP